MMFTMQDLGRSAPVIVRWLLVDSPVLITYGVGVVLSFSRWKRHPRISSLTLAALTILLATAVAFTMIYAMLPIYLNRQGIGFSRYDEIYMSVGVIRSLIHAAAIAILFAAIFGMQRERQAGFEVQPAGFPSRVTPPPMPPQFR